MAGVVWTIAVSKLTGKRARGGCSRAAAPRLDALHSGDYYDVELIASLPVLAVEHVPLVEHVSVILCWRCQTWQ